MNLARSPASEILVAYLRPQWPRVLALAALLVAGIGLQLVNPQVLRYFIDTTQAGSSQGRLVLAAGLFLGLALLHQALGVAATYASQQVAWTATNRLRHDLTLHCLRLDMAFHKQHTPGELIERIDGDITALGNFLSEFAIRVLANAVLVAGIVALLFREDWLAGAGLAVYALVTVVVLVSLQGRAARRWVTARQASAELFGFVEERIAGAEDIRSAGAIDYVLYRLFRLMRGWVQRYRAAFLASAVIYNFTNVLSVAGYAVGLALAVYLFTADRASIGTAYLIVAYTAMLAAPLHSLREQARDLQQSAASLERVHELFRREPRVTDPAARPGNGRAAPTGRLPAGPLPVAFESVSFRYEAEAGQVLHEVSLAVQPGRVLGLLGRTGSGKTTLTRLLFRLYDPDQGAIRLGGIDLRELPQAELRARIGLVTQDVQLFPASIRDNLTLFNPRITDAHLQQALQALELWDWVQTLPDGLATHLTGDGYGLSAGEAQLLAFARVFLKDPGVVVLDEASSRLDPATEARLERAIDRLLAGRTGLIIAHRLRTVQRADDILILEDGRVVEYGPRTQLAADPGSRFYHLLQTGMEAALV